MVDKNTDLVELEAALHADLDGWKMTPGADARAEFEALTLRVLSSHSGSKRLLALEQSIILSQELATKVCRIARTADAQLLLAKPKQYSNSFLRIVQRATLLDCSLDEILLLHRRGGLVLRNAHAAHTLHWQTMY